MSVSLTSPWMSSTTSTRTSCWASIATKWIALEGCRAIAGRRHRFRSSHQTIRRHRRAPSRLRQHPRSSPSPPAIGHWAFVRRRPTLARLFALTSWTATKSRTSRASKKSTTTWIAWRRSEACGAISRPRDDGGGVGGSQTAVKMRNYRKFKLTLIYGATNIH